jgi:hypothetical protein
MSGGKVEEKLVGPKARHSDWYISLLALILRGNILYNATMRHRFSTANCLRPRWVKITSYLGNGQMVNEMRSLVLFWFSQFKPGVRTSIRTSLDDTT